MSLRKYMHPRNKYKEEPNFKHLAILYPDFRQIVVTDLSGKVRLNFKEKNTLCVLTKTLLKHDFGLEVDISSAKLVPTMPLRLNYILWLEDLMGHAKYTDMSLINGIDIGTGAVGIYPLLFAKIYGCKMIATEIEPSSVQSAKDNIERNHLQDLVQIILVPKDIILQGAIPANESYSFTVCNPPFFENDEDLKGKSRKPNIRIPPRNAPTGSNDELIVEGGEKKFVLKMIEESVEIGERVKVYTTMLGQKSSLMFLIAEMKKKEIDNVIWTEFCQGHTKRWGLAWSFVRRDILDLTTAPVIRTKHDDLKMKRQKEHAVVDIVFPLRDTFSSMDDVVTALKRWLSELKMKIKELDLGEEELRGWACELVAYEDSWSHARRKRRLAVRSSPAKKPHLESADSVNDAKAPLQLIPAAKNSGNLKAIDNAEEINSSKPNERLSESNFHTTNETESQSVIPDTSYSTKDTVVETVSREPLLVCNLLINEGEAAPSEAGCDQKSNIKLSMIFDHGHGGKNALETFRQYLINKLNIREYLQKQGKHSAKKKKKKKKRLKKDEPRVEDTSQ